MKKIYKLTEKGKVAGICAGIADIYDLDPTLVRLGVVFLTIVTAVWPGVATYLVGWWLIPEKHDADESESE